MQKKLLAILLISILVFINMPFLVSATDEPIDPPITNPGGDGGQSSYEPNPTPDLKLASDGMITLKANSEQVVEVLVKNVSSFYAYNILVQAKANGDKIPYTFEILDKSNIQYSLQNGTTMKVKMLFKVDKNAPSGTYTIDLSYRFNSKNKTSFSGSDSLIVKIENEAISPAVVLTDFKGSKDTIAAGESINVSASLQNIGNMDAMDVKVSLAGLTAETIGLKNGSNTVYYQKYIPGFENVISFDFISNKDIKSGSYPVTFKLTYKDINDKEYSKDYDFYINVSGDSIPDEDKPYLEITQATAPTGIYNVGQEFQIKLLLKNNGKTNAKNVKITAVTDEEGAVVPHSSNTLQFTSIAVNESKELTFLFAPTNKSKSQNYSIGFNIEYETGEKKDDNTVEKLNFSQYVGVNVSNPENDKDEDDKDKKVTVPKIIISKYICNPIIVEAGKKFDIAMTFKNTHSQKTVKNVKLFINVDEKTEEKGNVFSPDNASNTFYIASIPPNGEVSHTFNMFTVPDAQARTYTIQVNFQYEDEEANPYESTELVGINVKQKTNLDTSEINIPAETYLGDPISVYFDLYNTGKTTLNNLMISIDGEKLDTANTKLFIGNLESGNSENYEGTFFANELGQQAGKIIISYDDTNGEHIEKVTDFQVNVLEPMPMNPEDMGGEMPVPEEKGIKNLLKNKYVMIGIGIAVILIIGATVFKIKKIKKQKGLDLDE